MLTITQHQTEERWDALPENLRNAIFNTEYIDTVWDTGSAEHLSEDKIEDIATIAGDVIMGFLKTDNSVVGKEIMERTGVNNDTALKIARELDKKIFSHIKDEIEKIYEQPTAKPITGAGAPPEMKIASQKQQEADGERIEIGTAEKPQMPNAPPQLNQQQPIEQKRPLDIQKPQTPQQPPETLVKTGEAAPLPIEEKHGRKHDDKPFMLHKIKPLFIPTTPPEKPSVRFGAKPEFKKKDAKRVVVNIETPTSKQQQTRVVHYSNLRTPLDSSENEAR